MRVGGWKGGRTEKRGGKTVDLEKLVEFHASAFIRVSSNPCIGPLPRAEASFFLLSLWTDELLSSAKIRTYLPQSKLGNEKLNTNQIQYHIPNKKIYLDQYF